MVSRNSEQGKVTRLEGLVRGLNMLDRIIECLWKLTPIRRIAKTRAVLRPPLPRLMLICQT